jgi:hypothetical protein
MTNRKRGGRRPTVGERLIQAAKEARAIARGEADPNTYNVYTPADIDKIRRRLKRSHLRIVKPTRD